MKETIANQPFELFLVGGLLLLYGLSEIAIGVRVVWNKQNILDISSRFRLWIISLFLGNTKASQISNNLRANRKWRRWGFYGLGYGILCSFLGILMIAIGFWIL